MNGRGAADLVIVSVVAISGAAVTATVLALQGGIDVPPPNLLAQIIQLGVILAIGVGAIKRLDAFRDQYAQHREQDARLDARGREELKNEIVAVEQRVMAAAEKDLDTMRSDLQKLDRTVNSLMEAVIGSPLHPGGLRESTRRNRERRHDIMNNLASLDARQMVVGEVLIDLAKRVGVALDPADMRAIQAQIQWRKLPHDEEEG